MKHRSMVMVLAAAGCSLTGGGAPEMPDYFLDASFETGLAQTVADACTSVRYLDAAGTARQTEVAQRYLSEGNSADDVKAWLASDDYDAWANQRTRAYLSAKGVNPDISLGAAEADACRIAEEEIAAGSGIGQLLEKV